MLLFALELAPSTLEAGGDHAHPTANRLLRSGGDGGSGSETILFVVWPASALCPCCSSSCCRACDRVSRGCRRSCRWRGQVVLPHLRGSRKPGGCRSSNTSKAGLHRSHEMWQGRSIVVLGLSGWRSQVCGMRPVVGSHRIRNLVISVHCIARGRTVEQSRSEMDSEDGGT